MAWTDGYPAEINYQVGFYRNLAPRHLALISVLQGTYPPQRGATYLELGCGAGLSTILLAATNPTDHFIGVDFAPSHIAEANGLAAEAGVGNVRFIEASFDDDDLIARLPPCDIVSLHGVYTWIGSRQRLAIRNILSKRLNSGGLFYIAYNNMVGASFEIVLQRALLELARTSSPGSLKYAFEKLKQMEQLGAENFRQNSSLLKLMAEIGDKSPSYLVHEYLTEHWKPYFFQDLARELEDSKLTFLGSAAPANNADEFVASPEMMNVIRGEPDANARQFLLDIVSNRRFRNDVFVRGSRAIEPDLRVALLREMTFALAKPKSDIEYKVTIGRGVLELRRPVFRAIVDHLEKGPNSLVELNLDDKTLVEGIVLLSQAAIIHPATQTPADPTMARRLNQAMFSNERRRAQYGFVAAPRIESAIPIALADRMALDSMGNFASPARGSPSPLEVESSTQICWRHLQIID